MTPASPAPPNAPPTARPAHQLCSLKTVANALHILMPFGVIVAALAFHAVHNPLPILMVVTLVSAAYGKSMWYDFLKSKVVRGTANFDAKTETKTETKAVTTTNTSKTDITVTVHDRDAASGVQATSA